ncbi:MAG: HAD family hydrolase [Candidatus Woesearchaeota archaeon]
MENRDNKENYVSGKTQHEYVESNGKTVLLDLWGVILDQEKAGEVMVDAYRKQAAEENVPAETIDIVVSDYQKVLQNDKSVSDRKGEIVNTLQDLAEKYIENSDDDEIANNLEESVYEDSIRVISRARSEGYNVAIFTTRAAEWVREFIEDELGEIYEAPEGKTAERFNEICRYEISNGRRVVSFTEDAAKALKAAQEAGYVINSIIYINRGDNGLSREECEENGIVYTENLEDVYDHIVNEVEDDGLGELVNFEEDGLSEAGE